MKENFGITMMEHSWWVRVGWVKVNGKRRPWFQRAFTYSKYNSKEKAYEAAELWRDGVQLVWNDIRKKLKIGHTLPFRSYPPKKNHSTGVFGVYITEYYSLKKGRVNPTHVKVCVANIRVNKKSYAKTWSCHKYGDKKAIELADKWRKEKESFFKKRPKARMVGTIKEGVVEET